MKYIIVLVINFLLLMNLSCNKQNNFYDVSYKKTKSISSFKLLYKNISDVNTLNKALILAVLEENIEKVRYLIKKGANINTQDRYGDSPLLIAAFNNYFQIVKLLLNKGSNINEKENNGNTALLLALYNGHLKIAKYLIEKGANTKIRNKKGFSALIVAAWRGHIEIVKLIAKNCHRNEINSRNKKGYSALMYACYNGHLNVVKYLLNKKVSNLKKCLKIARLKKRSKIVTLITSHLKNRNN